MIARAWNSGFSWSLCASTGSQAQNHIKSQDATDGDRKIDTNKEYQTVPEIGREKKERETQRERERQREIERERSGSRSRRWPEHRAASDDDAIYSPFVARNLSRHSRVPDKSGAGWVMVRCLCKRLPVIHPAASCGNRGDSYE